MKVDCCLLFKFKTIRGRAVGNNDPVIFITVGFVARVEKRAASFEKRTISLKPRCEVESLYEHRNV